MIQLDDIASINSMKKGIFNMERYLNKMKTSNKLKFKLVSGTHGLRSELSRRDNGSDLCMCCDMDKEESGEHLLL
eukprot:Awhi_evm1s11167